MRQVPGIIQQKPEQTEQLGATAPVSYFRSRLYTAPYASNPLLAAASPIFSLLDRLSLSITLPPIEQLRQDLKYELQAYQSRIQQNGQENPNHQIAYFLLTATIDELIARHYFRIYQKPVSFQAFSPLGSEESSPGLRFFKVIDKIQTHPNQYLDIIEIAYFCLMAGFEGQYHEQIDGRQQIDNLCETLYQIIRQNRTHQKSYSKQSHQTKDIRTIHKRYFPMAATLGAIALVSTIYLCHHQLDRKIKMMPLGSNTQSEWINHAT